MSLSKKTKPELTKMLWEEFQEHAYARWTKAEILTRIHELQEARGIDPWTRQGKQKTPLREQIAQLNKNKKNKAALVGYATSEIGIMLNGNETMEQIEYRAIKEIYRATPATKDDPVGFGRHAQLTYGELRNQQASYAQWVKKRAVRMLG